MERQPGCYAHAARTCRRGDRVSQIVYFVAQQPRGNSALQPTRHRARDEIAPLHSITSSAIASTLGAMVRPSALAVLRFMTNSNFAGCIIGKLAGFSPLSIRAA